MAVADGVVYYLGNDRVYAFDGSMPVCVSRALGDKRYTGGVAKRGKRPVLAVRRGRGGETELLVYDTQKRLWHRQDDTAAVAFARWNRGDDSTVQRRTAAGYKRYIGNGGDRVLLERRKRRPGTVHAGAQVSRGWSCG